MTAIAKYLAYHDWALNRLLANIVALDDVAYHQESPLALKSIHKTLVHIAYYTHKPFGKEPNLASYSQRELAALLERASAHLLALSREEHAAMADILWQIVLHNLYHYGQINALLAVVNVEVDSLDIFVFLDE